MKTLYINGRIWTGSPTAPEVSALATDGTQVVAVGNRDHVQSRLGGGQPDRVIDLAGKRVLPGLVDAHAHLALFAMEWANIRLKDMKSIDQILEAVGRQALASPKGDWIRGSGYNHLTLREGRHPTRDDLDRVAPHHPVILTRTCGHIASVNTAALNRAGLHAKTPDPPGGKFGRTAQGELNGVLYDQALSFLQVASKPADVDLERWLGDAAQVWLQSGITAFHDAGGPPDYFRVLLNAIRKDAIPQRVEAMVWNGLGVDQLGDFLPSHIATGFQFRNFRIGAAKIMIDGSSSGPTAATRQPYGREENFCGILYRDQEELNQWVKRAAEEGFQCTTHAVGDRAIEYAVRALATHGNPTMRNRIEHCAMCPRDLVERLRQTGITPVGQPAFLWEFGDGYVDSYGLERAQTMFPFKSWLEAGLRPAGSSDAPITDYRPLRGVATAVFRMTSGGRVLNSAECLTMDQALRLYTVNPARLSFGEPYQGRLMPGYQADLVVLEEDIWAMSNPDDIANCPIEKTVIDGEIVWEIPGNSV